MPRPTPSSEPTETGRSLEIALRPGSGACSTGATRPRPPLDTTRFGYRRRGSDRLMTQDRPDPSDTLQIGPNEMYPLQSTFLYEWIGSMPWPSAPTGQGRPDRQHRQGRARLWDAATGRPLRRAPDPSESGHGRGVQPRRHGRPDRAADDSGAAVGRGHRPAHRAGHDHEGRSMPWPSAPTAGRPDRQLRRDGAAVGRGHRRAARAALTHRGPVVAVAFSPDGGPS